MNSKIVAAVAVAALLASTLAFVSVEADDTASNGFSVTDGEGRTFTYDAPAERIVSVGSATTLTIAEAGAAYFAITV